MTLTPEELGKKIDAARQKDAPKPAAAGDRAAMGPAMRAGVDLVAALMVGGFLGFQIDRWLGTKPFAMIIFLFLGFAAGFFSIYKSQTTQKQTIGFKNADKE